MQRKVWIDLMRGISMMAILLFHTEMYYAGRDIISYNLYVANALCAFYFLSGYLFHSGRRFEPLKKLRSIVRGLLLPYFIFTLLIAVPKALVHGNSLAPMELLHPILTGTASWFVASLIVAELIFTLFIYFARGRERLILAFGVLMLVLSMMAQRLSLPDWWYWKEALLALFFLSLGYVFHGNESRSDFLFKPAATIVVLLLLISLKCAEQFLGINLVIVNISNYAVFALDMTLGILLLMSMCRKIWRIRIMEWTGRTSLYYYFLCGGVPLTVGRLMNLAGLEYSGSYLLVAFAFLTVYAITTLAVWIICRIITLCRTSGRFVILRK